MQVAGVLGTSLRSPNAQPLQPVPVLNAKH